MQATITTRRLDTRKIKQAALAVGLLTSLAIGATTASIVRDTSDNGGTAALAGAATTRNEITSYTFREQNFDLPTGGASQATHGRFDYAFMEQNLNLPGSSVQPAARSYDDIRFSEQNLHLPGPAVSSTAPDWRVIEANSFGEDATFSNPLPQAQDPELIR